MFLENKFKVFILSLFLHVAGKCLFTTVLCEVQRLLLVNCNNGWSHVGNVAIKTVYQIKSPKTEIENQEQDKHGPLQKFEAESDTVREGRRTSKKIEVGSGAVED